MEQPKKKQTRRKTGPLPEDFEEIMVQAGREGKHLTDFLKQFGWNKPKHLKELQSNNNYVEAYERYLVECEDYWYNFALNAMKVDGGMGFNNKLWSLIMRNKFANWEEGVKKVDITTNGESIDIQRTIQVEIIKAKADVDSEYEKI